MPALRHAIPALALALGACGTTQDSSPLIFGQATTVGITVGQSATAQTPELIVGVRQANLAVVPTTVPAETEVADGFRRIRGSGPTSASGQAGTEDALSTFGSFSNETSVNEVRLGVFFATGVAAQNISNGFKCAVAEGRVFDCDPSGG